MDVLPTVNNTVQLTEVPILKLLRLYLGDLGQYYFDARRLNEEATLEDALRQLTKPWGSQDNIIAARYRFQQMTQQPNETIDDFLNRLQQLVPSCDYKSIPSFNVEDAMLLQGLIPCTRDSKARERLLTAEDCLSFGFQNSLHRSS